MLIFQAEGTLTENWKYTSSPSFFLKPPTILQTFNTQNSVKLSQPAFNKNSRSIFSKWFLPSKTTSTKSLHIPSDAIAKSSDFTYHDLHCNPCNSVPWIPILTFTQQKAFPELTHQSLPVSALDSYYQTINEMTSNLVKPINILTPNRLPFYIGPPVYQQHARNPTWHIRPSSKKNSIDHTRNLQFSDSSLLLPQIQSNDEHTNEAVSNWIQNTKTIPFFHYMHSVDYPTQFMQTSSTNLLQHAKPIAQSQAAYSNTGNFNPSNNFLRDVSNHLEDTKYSSSENRISVSSNDTAKDSKQLKSNENKILNTTELTDYLTPPAITFSDEWTHAQEEEQYDDWESSKEVEIKAEKRKKQIQIVIPYTMNNGKHNTKQLEENSTKWEPILKTTDIRSTSSSTVLPIIRYLRDNPPAKRHKWTDWHKLRKAIDSWTLERFSNHRYNNSDSEDSTTSTLSPSKEIPKNYSYSSITYGDNNDLKENPDEMQNRASYSHTKTEILSSNRELKLRKTLPAPSSSTIKEKVYIVTPLPINNYNFSSNDIGILNWRL